MPLQLWTKPLLALGTCSRPAWPRNCITASSVRCSPVASSKCPTPREPPDALTGKRPSASKAPVSTILPALPFDASFNASKRYDHFSDQEPLPLLVSLDGLVGIAESICDLMVGTEPNLPFFYLLKSKWRDRENLSKRLNQCWITAEPAEQATFAISDFAITISEDG